VKITCTVSNERFKKDKNNLNRLNQTTENESANEGYKFGQEEESAVGKMPFGNIALCNLCRV